MKDEELDQIAKHWERVREFKESSRDDEFQSSDLWKKAREQVLKSRERTQQLLEAEQVRAQERKEDLIQMRREAEQRQQVISKEEPSLEEKRRLERERRGTLTPSITMEEEQWDIF